MRDLARAAEGLDRSRGTLEIAVANRYRVPPANGSSEWANRISQWLLTERVPVTAPDRRWDRLLYGIHSVEEYLKARA